jgi:Carboxypeptidase regulatory-like domain
MLLLAAACSAAAGPGTGGEPGPGALIGRVVDADGEPVRGVRVQLGASLEGAQLTTTDADGAFTFADAPALYDLAAVAHDAYVFEGLSIRTPTLTLFGAHLSPRWHSAVVHPDLGPEHVVLLAEPADESTARVRVDPLPGSNDVDLSWVSDGPARVNLYALALAGDRPEDGYAGVVAVRGAEVDEGKRFDVRGPIQPVEETRVTATVSAGGATTVDGVSAALRIGSRGAPSWLPDASAPAGSPFEIKIPKLEGAVVDLVAVGSSSAGTVSTKRGGLVPGAAGVGLDLSEPPSLDAPADRARAVTAGSELRWRSSASTVHWVRIEPLGQELAAYWIATSGSSVRLPDLEALGAPLRPGASYGWYVVDAARATRVDDAAVVGALDTVDGPAGNTRERRFEAGP